MGRRLIPVVVCAMLVSLSAFVLVRTASRDRQAGDGRPPIVLRHASSIAPSRPYSSVTAGAPERLPTAAVQVATRYARAAFTTFAGEPSDGWVTTVAPLCTPAWLRHLESARNGIVEEAVSDRPVVVRVFPSWAPRHDVGATVFLSDPRGGNDAIYLVLVRVGGRFLVRAAQ